MCKAAHACRRYLQDGTMFSHGKRIQQIVQETRQADTNHTVNRIDSSFCFQGDETFFRNDIRCRSRENGGDPLGCIGDVGWYCVRLALHVFGSDHVPVRARVTDFALNEQNVPMDATCIVEFQEVRREKKGKRGDEHDNATLLMIVLALVSF